MSFSTFRRDADSDEEKDTTVDRFLSQHITKKQNGTLANSVFIEQKENITKEIEEKKGACISDVGTEDYKDIDHDDNGDDYKDVGHDDNGDYKEEGAAEKNEEEDPDREYTAAEADEILFNFLTSKGYSVRRI
jgi:hypothetical protein